MSALITSGAITVAGRRIHYEDTRRGDTSILFVHGIGCDLTDWDRQVAALDSEFRIVRLDLAGHGQSAEAAIGFDIPGCGRDILALVDVLALKNLVLVGHSMGCKAILAAVLALPQVARGLIFLDGSRASSASAQVALKAVRDQIEQVGIRGFMAGMFDQMFTPASDRDLRQKAMERVSRLPDKVARSFVESVVAWDAGHLDEVLRTIATPVLTIQSTHLNEARQRVATRQAEMDPFIHLIKERVADSRFLLFPDVGHFNMIEAHERVTAEIRDFAHEVCGNLS